MTTTTTTINEHVFIRRIFLEVSPDWRASVSKNAVQVQKKTLLQAIYLFGNGRTQMQRDCDVNKWGTARNRFAARSSKYASTDGHAAGNGPFDFESKLEKRDVTTAPAANFMCEIETYGRRQSDAPNSARARENPITRFIIECQSLCHLCSEYWTKEQAGPSFRRQSEILNECECWLAI
jgi:hypothetical protein